MSNNILNPHPVTGIVHGNNITVCLNEIRGYADAFVEMIDKSKGTSSSTNDENVRNVCNKVCDKIGFIDEDAQPDFSDYDFFNECMDDLVLYSKTDSSSLRYIDISISVYDIDYKYFLELMRHLSGNVKLSILGSLKVVSSVETTMSFQTKFNFLDWVHLYKIIKSLYSNEENSNHALFKVLDTVADHLEVANPHFTRKFFESIQL